MEAVIRKRRHSQVDPDDTSDDVEMQLLAPSVAAEGERFLEPAYKSCTRGNNSRVLVGQSVFEGAPTWSRCLGLCAAVFDPLTEHSVFNARTGAPVGAGAEPQSTEQQGLQPGTAQSVLQPVIDGAPGQGPCSAGGSTRAASEGDAAHRQPWRCRQIPAVLWGCEVPPFVRREGKLAAWSGDPTAFQTKAAPRASLKEVVIENCQGASSSSSGGSGDDDSADGVDDKEWEE